MATPADLARTCWSPTCPAPFAQFDALLAWDKSVFVFHLTFAANFSCHIQTATTLAVNPILWINLASSTSRTFTDLTATNFSTRFYRVVSP